MTDPTALTVLLTSLRAARMRAEAAYEAAAPNSHERTVLSGVCDDLDTSIRQVRDLAGAA